MLAKGLQDSIGIRVEGGFPKVLDDLADKAAGARSFLRAGWFEAAAREGGRTIVARRTDGSPVAAIPIAGAGPRIAGVHSVPGSYWPFRSILIDPQAERAELARLFADPRVRSALAPCWRVGPAYRDDPAITSLKCAASQSGWTVLTRRLGTTWMLPLGAETSGGEWPRKSTRRRLKNYERQLERTGPVTYQTISGGQWSPSVLEALAQIEAGSWVGKNTDGSGAKFLRPEQRDYWRSVTRDPAIAEALSATILMVGSIPAAFSFDLRAGDIQYSIGSSFDERFAAARPGKMVTYRQLEVAAAQGVTKVDLGAGDSGYKREMGAIEGSEIIDLLIVRNRAVAQLLQFKWGAESELGRKMFVPAVVHPHPSRRLLRPLLAASAITAAAVAMAE